MSLAKRDMRNAASSRRALARSAGVILARAKHWRR